MKGGNMKTVKHEIKLERSVKIIFAILAVGVFLNAFAIVDLISPAKASHDTDTHLHRGYGSLHVTMDNWPQGLKN